jgi:hypothetical protein
LKNASTYLLIIRAISAGSVEPRRNGEKKGVSQNSRFFYSSDRHPIIAKFGQWAFDWSKLLPRKFNIASFTDSDAMANIRPRGAARSRRPTVPATSNRLITTFLEK